MVNQCLEAHWARSNHYGGLKCPHPATLPIAWVNLPFEIGDPRIHGLGRVVTWVQTLMLANPEGKGGLRRKNNRWLSWEIPFSKHSFGFLFFHFLHWAWFFYSCSLVMILHASLICVFLWLTCLIWDRAWLKVKKRSSWWQVYMPSVKGLRVTLFGWLTFH